MRFLPFVAATLLAALALPAAQADPAIPMKGGAGSTDGASASAAPAASASPVTAAPSPAGGDVAAAALPDGRVLLRQFIEACGGAGAFAKVRNLELKGTVSIPAQGLAGNLVIYQDKPNRVLSVVEFPSLKVEQGFDGVTGWARDPVQGPRILEGEELEQLKNSGGELEVFGYANPDEYFTRAETLARTTYDSKDAWKVALATKGGEELVAYFDPASMLQLGMETTLNSIMGKMAVAVSFSDWRDFSGMKLPTKMTQSMMGMKTLMTVDSLNVNLAELPSFSPPAEVTSAQE